MQGIPRSSRSDDFSLDLRAGEIHCIVGENGAGKSTFVKVLSGSVSRNGGRILIDGREVDLSSPGSAKKNGIAVIYQDSDSNLVPEISIAQNLLGRERANKIGCHSKEKGRGERRRKCSMT